MFCSHCGKYTEDGSVFCGNCGKKISADAKAAVQTNEEDRSETNHGQQLPWLAAKSKEEKGSGAVNTTAAAQQIAVEKKTSPPGEKKINLQSIVIILLTALLLAVIVTGGIFIWKITRGSQAVDSNAEPAASLAAQTPPASSAPASEPGFDMEKLNGIITQKTASNHVAVAIQDFSSRQLYTTSNANTAFVAAGFYAPLYVAAYGDESTASDILRKADHMMATMDNDAANAVIDGLGGLQGVNELLRYNQFEKTVFNRKLGDVAASKQGKENYTSAKEAASFLEILYDRGGYEKMEGNLQAAGISLPKGAVYAHRGLGIGTSYNIFAVVDTPSKSYSVVILTKDMGNTAEAVKRNAVPLISELLAAISGQADNGAAQ